VTGRAVDGRVGPGTLVLVATPIGNLGDLAPRAVAALASADVLCCEDTRRTRALLSAAGVPLAGRPLLALHAHNEAARTATVLEHLGRGATVAVVTDAGTPAVSDPGARLVAAAVGAGVAVRVVPGPSAVLAALVVSGLPTDRFCVEGFLPRKGTARRRRLASLATEERTAVILEAPGRLAPTLEELAAALGPRPVAVARELTKIHETVWRGPLDAAAAHFAAEPARGEVVLVVGGAAPPPPADDGAVRDAVRARLAQGAAVREVADAVAAELQISHRRAYEAALAERAAAPAAGGRTGRDADG
jgi:16S rRNA (cytidine1402-2'-O)-methyltransferase